MSGFYTLKVLPAYSDKTSMKLILATLMLSLSTLSLAHSQCEQLYERQLKVIAEKVDYQSSAGGGAYINPNGSIGYHPGVTLTKEGPNWVRDVLFAINYGPEQTIFSKTDGRSREFLKDLTKVLAKECKLRPDPQYTNLRLHLKSLLVQDQLCPQGQILAPSIFGSYKKIHQVVVKSLRDEDHFSLCDQAVVRDDSHRSVKEVPSAAAGKTSSRVKSN